MFAQTCLGLERQNRTVPLTGIQTVRKDVERVSSENHTKAVEEKTQHIAQHPVQLKSQQGIQASRIK